MELLKCLICNETLPDNLKGGAAASSKSKKSRASDGSGGVQLISDAKSKFALTVNQYLILQKVLSLPVGTCKTELINGPYCRECFTNINNVCHIMSALENLQESVQEFRKDFGIKLKASFDAAGISNRAGSSSNSRKRKLQAVGDDEGWVGTRRTILDSLVKNSFLLAPPPPPTNKGSNKPKYLHEIISEMDPENNPETNVDAELVLRTTNGDMPTLKRSGSGSRAASAKKYQSVGSKAEVAVAAKSTKSSPQTSKKAKVVEEFPCIQDGCNKRFAKATGLSAHMDLVHKNTGIEGEFVCWYCKQSFDTTEKLQEHEMKHKGSKQCPICKKKFSRVNTLNRHMFTHKEKPSLACDLCSMTFSTKKGVDRHKSRDHKAKKGSLIMKFSSSSNITKKTFRPGRCKLCNRIVTNLQSHMTSAHPEKQVNGNDSSNSNNSSKSSTNGHKPGPASSKQSCQTTDSVDSKEANGDNIVNKADGEALKEPEKAAEDNSNDIKTEEHEDKLDTKVESKRIEEIEDAKSQIKEETPKKSDSNEIRRSLILAPTLSLPPPPPQQQGSKYQFKTLLIKGEKK